MSERPLNWRPGRKPADRARRIAFEVLCDVEMAGAYANIALPKALSAARMNRQDASFATNLCYGTLRLSGRWDAILRHCMDRSDIDIPVRVLLRMGAHQLLELRTPPHAAINESVNLARAVVGSGASGFINAVLRRVSERNIQQWQEQLVADAGGKVNSVAFLSEWFSHPQWIIRALASALAAHGRSTRDLISVLRAHNTPTDVALVARGISREDLGRDIERGRMHWHLGELVDSAVILEGGDPGRIFAVQDHLAGVQDEGSQLVARTFSSAPIHPSRPDNRWLDMCAGPGGKAATLAASNPQVKIYANEIHEHRLRLVEKAVAPWSDSVVLRCGDGADIGQEQPEFFDRVLIDAPCTGIGALRRRPESRWRKEAGDALDLTRTQLALLESGWQALAPGGLLGYCTCSPYGKETLDVMETFLAARPDAALVDARSYAQKQALRPIVGSTPYLQLWPDLHGSDAMFLALVTKKVH
ncbi:transcription antitermination factor NusB [Trueperella sp. LYQ143]|uniref:transcription antitermination factor NusB n=1 Tax=unclassified Trueperella TaxID=2630174 RepID=UPI003982DE21